MVRFASRMLVRATVAVVCFGPRTRASTAADKVWVPRLHCAVHEPAVVQDRHHAVVNWWGHGTSTPFQRCRRGTGYGLAGDLGTVIGFSRAAERSGVCDQGGCRDFARSYRHGRVLCHLRSCCAWQAMAASDGLGDGGVRGLVHRTRASAPAPGLGGSDGFSGSSGSSLTCWPPSARGPSTAPMVGSTRSDDVRTCGGDRHHRRKCAPWTDLERHAGHITGLVGHYGRLYPQPGRARAGKGAAPRHHRGFTGRGGFQSCRRHGTAACRCCFGLLRRTTCSPLRGRAWSRITRVAHATARGRHRAPYAVQGLYRSASTTTASARDACRRLA